MAAQFLVIVHHHKNTIFFFLFNLVFSVHGLTRGSSLSVENNDDVLLSPNGFFTAGFHHVGDNAFCFAVWFTDQPSTEDPKLVWMANRDAPVNGKYSKLSLFEDGNLVLIDANQYIIWSTHTKSSSSSLELELYNTGSLVLHTGGKVLWQSFDYPTDTLLPDQPLVKNTQLISSRSSSNYSSGFYKLFFDIDSILRLHYEGLESSSVYWPDPDYLTWELGRIQYINSHIASLDSEGRFNSSDGFGFSSSDFGIGPQRMIKIDIDGNLRLYSLINHKKGTKWEVQWQAISHSCRVHGICGPNSLCSYSRHSGRKCTCLHGYTMVNSQDWSFGCAPEFKTCSQEHDQGFIKLHQVEFYGYDIRFHFNTTLHACKRDCLNDCSCKGFQFAFDHNRGTFYCFIKSYLYNGYQMAFGKSMYIKLPKTSMLSLLPKTLIKRSNFSCANQIQTPMIRSYNEKHDSKLLNIVLILGCVIGFIEIIGIAFFWYKSLKHSITSDQECYFPAATTFRKFTYSELKKASRNFSQEIGRGGTGVVYRGFLSDNRIAAIKKLKNTNHQGEDEFQAEISTFGRLNHMNLIETWGYCAEGKRRLIVYEYMENGSLADNLGKLDWKTRFNIAIGTAKGLAYLHEECLEWVLHCDVKPHNILLDGNFNPKVADFGLSKLLDRGRIDHKSNFSTVRGTRGYMAPEWVFNLPITSKVDVFSYGVVILEMVTGRSPSGKQERSHENGGIERGLVEWLRDRVKEFDGSRLMESWVEKIVNPMISGEYDRRSMQNLVRIALKCAYEDMKVRPSMKEVVNMLLHSEYT